MALKINMVSSIGVVASYHRISKVELNDSEALLTIQGYTSDTYRANEKKIKSDLKEREELMQLITKEMSKPEDERNTTTIIEWTDRANALVYPIQTLDFAISNNTERVTFDKSAPISYEELYLKLKELDKYKDAEDV